MPETLWTGRLSKHCGVAGPQRRHQDVRHVAAEALAIGGPLEQGGGDQAGGAQGGGGERGGVAMPERHGQAAALAAGRPPVAAGHGGGRGLVEEDEPIRVKVWLAVEPGLAGGHYVRPVLLGGVDRPLLRVMAWRAKKRDSPLVLVRRPCPATWSRSSRRNIVGWRLYVARISPACASTRCDMVSPPDGLGAASPSCRIRPAQRLALAALTPKRVAASRHEGRRIQKPRRAGADQRTRVTAWTGSSIHQRTTLANVAMRSGTAINEI